MHVNGLPLTDAQEYVSVETNEEGGFFWSHEFLFCTGSINNYCFLTPCEYDLSVYCELFFILDPSSEIIYSQPSFILKKISRGFIPTY